MTLTTRAIQIFAAVPNPNPVQPPGTGHVSTAIGYWAWIAGACLLVGAIGAGVALGFEVHGGRGGSTATTWLGRVVVGCLVLACAAPVINALI